MTEFHNVPDDAGAYRREIQERRRIPTISTVLADGSVVESLLLPETLRTAFCISKDGQVRTEPSIQTAEGLIVPFAPDNNLLAHEVVLLPSRPEAFGSSEALTHEIQAFIHRYVDVSPLFEKISTYYVLLSWIYEAFNELPYLRLRGDPGSGKTRFLLVVGSICYKPIFASGASTVSPLFRILDAVRGTLIIDEGDFRLSDERAEIVKILNNGHAKGFPVLRSEVINQREFDPRAYAVFGPKLVATRRYFDDPALESRCITEEMGLRRLRDDIPITLPASWRAEALSLRNKLLSYRFQELGRMQHAEAPVDRSIEPRLNQIFMPLFAIISDDRLKAEVRDLARRYHREMVADRSMDVEGELLEVIRDLSVHGGELAVKDITSWFGDRYGAEYDRKISAKWIGHLLRRELRLRTEKRHGSYVIASGERAKLGRLFERYGVETHAEESTKPAAECA